MKSFIQISSLSLALIFGFTAQAGNGQIGSAGYQFDDNLRYECDMLGSTSAVSILTKKSIEKGLMQSNGQASAWEVSHESKHFFGVNRLTKRIEQIQVKVYRSDYADVNTAVVCAGTSGAQKSAHLVNIEDYQDLVSLSDVSYLRCAVNSDSGMDVDVIFVQKNLKTVMINNENVTEGCGVDNQILQCDAKSLTIDLSKLITKGPSTTDQFLSFLGGGNSYSSQFYKGEIKTGLFSRSEMNCYP